MTLAFNLFLHILLVAAIVSFLWFVVKSALSETDTWERVLRLAAMVAGALVALGAQVSGVSYAEFTVASLATSTGPSAATAFAAAVIPALTGAGLGFLLIHTMNRSTRIGHRVMGFVAMLAGVGYTAIYALATQTNGVFLGAAAIPNVSFVAGVILTIVFTWDPESRSGGVGALSALAVMWKKRSSGSAPRPSAPEEVAKRDPFAEL